MNFTLFTFIFMPSRNTRCHTDAFKSRETPYQSKNAPPHLPPVSLTNHCHARWRLRHFEMHQNREMPPNSSLRSNYSLEHPSHGELHNETASSSPVPSLPHIFVKTSLHARFSITSTKASVVATNASRSVWSIH